MTDPLKSFDEVERHDPTEGEILRRGRLVSWTENPGNPPKFHSHTVSEVLVPRARGDQSGLDQSRSDTHPERTVSKCGIILGRVLSTLPYTHLLSF